MYQFRTLRPNPVPNPVITLNVNHDADPSLRKPLHSGISALEGLVISLGGEVRLDKPVTVKRYKEDTAITALGMTDAGLLAIAADNPDKEFLLWGLSASGTTCGHSTNSSSANTESSTKATC